MCARPITLTNEKNCDNPIFYGGEPYLEVRCGKCMPCRITKINEWKLRLERELRRAGSGVFFGMSYDDKNLPEYGALKYDDLIEFNHLLRKKLYRKKWGKRKLKYYCVGEYGDQNGRPHYHGIYFGINPTEMEVIGAPLWKKGFTFSGTVTPESIGYTLGYVSKKIYGQKANYPLCIPPKAIISNGLGENIPEGDYHKKRQHKIPLSRYELNKKYGDNRRAKSDYWNRMKEELKLYERVSELWKKTVDKGGKTIYDLKHTTLEEANQKDINLIAKMSMRRKGKL